MYKVLSSHYIWLNWVFYLRYRKKKIQVQKQSRSKQLNRVLETDKPWKLTEELVSLSSAKKQTGESRMQFSNTSTPKPHPRLAPRGVKSFILVSRWRRNQHWALTKPGFWIGLAIAYICSASCCEEVNGEWNIASSKYAVNQATTKCHSWSVRRRFSCAPFNTRFTRTQQVYYWKSYRRGQPSWWL